MGDYNIQQGQTIMLYRLDTFKERDMPKASAIAKEIERHRPIEVLRRSMSAIQLEVLLHYYYLPEQWADAGRHTSISSENAHDYLLKMELLSKSGEKYSIAERGKVYVDAILATPLPEKRWVMG